LTPSVTIPEDTNGDGIVTALDVLLLVNYLNAHASGGGTPAPSGEFPALYDVNRDGRVTPLDVLLVINYLNRAAMGGGEGESAPNPQVFVAAPSASLSSESLLSEPSPDAVVRRESPVWPASDPLGDAWTTEATDVVQKSTSAALEPALADLDDVLEDIAEQISRDWQSSRP
jgi:hypothetical protein